MNLPAKNNKVNPNTLLIILITVLLTSTLVIALLYSLGYLSFGGNHLVSQSVHIDGMVHTEGMVHTDGMHDGSTSSRQQEVAERGSMVMPFDLDRSTHLFEKTEFGGIQEVVSDDNDSSEIKLIQAHLLEEVERFQTGDFGDPAAIHGHDMPGLAELEAGYQQIDVAYEPLPDGGRITYSTADEQLQMAIYKWFEAQLSDHGDHAQNGSPTD